MPKQTVVVEFEDKEIREFLLAKAKELLGKTIQGSSEISIAGIFAKGKQGELSGPMDSIACKITFNGKVDK